MRGRTHASPRAARRGGRDRRRRHRRRCHGSERAGSRRLGHRGNHRSADALHQERRHRRPGALRHSRSAGRQLPGLGARLRVDRLAEDARETRPDPQPHRHEGARREIGGALLSGDLLVHDDEDPAGCGLRRARRHPEGHHAGNLAAADEQCRLRRLPSARAGGDAHDPGAVRQVRLRRRRLDPPHRLGAIRRDDDQPARRPARGRAVQVFRRLDRPRRERRSTEEQATSDRPASSATSWSPRGTGRRRTNICTT